MGIYSRYLFPWLCDFALDTSLVRAQRRQLLAEIQEEAILEIGFGSGLNLPHYPDPVRKVTTVDPSAGMYRRAQRRLQQSQIVVDHHPQRGEALPFADESFACVVSTFTLCSVEDIGQTMREIFRVLKPAGQFLFLEHGLSPDDSVQRWQWRLNGMQQWLGDGCQLIHNIAEQIESQPFSETTFTTGYLENMPQTHSYLYKGIARK